MNSKHGEGSGVPMSECEDPNHPSYDPATCFDDSTKTLFRLCNEAWDKLDGWEQRFVKDVYGRSPMSRKTHIRIWKMKKKYLAEATL